MFIRTAPGYIGLENRKMSNECGEVLQRVTESIERSGARYWRKNVYRYPWGECDQGRRGVPYESLARVRWCILRSSRRNGMVPEGVTGAVLADGEQGSD